MDFRTETEGTQVLGDVIKLLKALCFRTSRSVHSKKFQVVESLWAVISVTSSRELPN